jgi:hypothetical protein
MLRCGPRARDLSNRFAVESTAALPNAHLSPVIFGLI